MGLYWFALPRASPVTVDGVTDAETDAETDLVGIFFRSTDIEAAGRVVKEVGFWGSTGSGQRDARSGQDEQDRWDSR